MVAVQVGKEHLVELTRMHAGGGQAHRDSTPAIEEQVEAARLHEVGRSGPVGRGQGRTGAEQCERG